MAENYGLPYTGSKSRIAHWVVDNLPRGAFSSTRSRAGVPLRIERY